MSNSNSDRYDLIVGASGQDGFYLQEFLKTQDRKFLCVDTDGLIGHDVNMPEFDICNANLVSDLLKRYSIDHIYFLAAYHHSAEQQDANHIETLKVSMDIHVYAFNNFLRAIIEHRPSTKIFYAASSHLFSGIDIHNVKNKILIDENTPLSPKGWYAISKAAGVELVKSARDKEVFAVCGYLFNHESVRRPKAFLSSKLTHGALDAMLGEKNKLELLDVEAQVDWGYAPDYVKAMFLTLEHTEAQDYVIATGKLNSVADYAEQVYEALGMDWREFVTVKSDTAKKIGGATTLTGDSTRLMNATGWHPETSFNQMVARILQETAKERDIQLKEK